MTMRAVSVFAVIIVIVSLLGWVGWLKSDIEFLESENQTLSLSNTTLQKAREVDKQLIESLSIQVKDLQDSYAKREEDIRKKDELLRKAELEKIDTSKVVNYETRQKIRDILNTPPPTYDSLRR